MRRARMSFFISEEHERAAREEAEFYSPQAEREHREEVKRMKKKIKEDFY